MNRYRISYVGLDNKRHSYIGLARDIREANSYAYLVHGHDAWVWRRTAVENVNGPEYQVKS